MPRVTSAAFASAAPRLLVFGAGGHGRELAWLAGETHPGREVLHVVDEDVPEGGRLNGVPVHRRDEVALGPDDEVVVALGHPEPRRRVADQLAAAGARFATLVHPRAELSPHVSIGEGSVVCAGTVVTTNVEIGRHVHVNVACSLSHDVRLASYATLSPGVHLAGAVHVGEGVFIGVGASVINGRADAPLTIGDGAVVAAGACVTRSVEPGALVAGVPAVRKR
jgi:sugar O-acyltransferase (sialic acid O-acetyltransferase NeuD family)